MVSLDDTQPTRPVQIPPGPPLLEPEPTVRGGPGCLVYGLISLFILGIAGAIIALSAFAGWSSGTRTAQVNATATQGAAIDEQLSRIPGDVNSGNQVLLLARIRYLATLTPAVPGLDEIFVTATALYERAQPSPTPTPAPITTAEVTPSPAPPVAVTNTPGATLDLAKLLGEARTAIQVRDWNDAIESLDVILAADSTFEPGVVRGLMLQALTSRALELFRSGNTGDLAEANRLTDRARQYGDVGELNYESFVASLYLDAINSIGVDFNTSIQRLTELYRQVPNYKDVAQRLFNQYAAYGDAWVAQGEYCPAVVQYQNALRVLNDASVGARLNNAQMICAQATPPIPVDVTPLPGVAPVGVVTPPGM